MIDAEKALEGLGGGPLAVVCIGLAAAVLILWRAYDRVQEARHSDSRESLKAINEVNRALDALTNALRGDGRG